VTRRAAGRERRDAIVHTPNRVRDALVGLLGVVAVVNLVVVARPGVNADLLTALNRVKTLLGQPVWAIHNGVCSAG
jgi:hypothetical protein